MLHHARSPLGQAEVFRVLSNPRRRETVRRLGEVRDAISVRELSEAIAAAETGVSPPPRDARETVYVSLHQTHLPALHDLGIVEYDREERAVRPLGPVRVVRRYMELEALPGLPWSVLYRTLGVIALLLVVCSLVGVPVVAAVDPVLWASGFLLAFALAGVSELRSYRHALARPFARR